MIKNAKLYEKQIREKFWEIDYNPYYQYYYGSVWRSNFSLDSEYRRDFAILNGKDEVVGLIGYGFNMDNKVADKFGLIHFGAHEKKELDTDSLTISHALYKVIDDIFVKFGMNYLEFSVIAGNPVADSYYKLVNKIGGRVLCERKNRAMLLDGTLANDITFEINREQYLDYKVHNKNIRQKINEELETKQFETKQKEKDKKEFWNSMIHESQLSETDPLKYPIIQMEKLDVDDIIKVLEILPSGYIIEYQGMTHYLPCRISEEQNILSF